MQLTVRAMSEIGQPVFTNTPVQHNFLGCRFPVFDKASPTMEDTVTSHEHLAALSGIMAP